jgi:uncharacterized protein YjbI with pentapeptide repeats
MNYFNKKIFALIALLIFALLLILGKNYIIKEAKEIVKVPSIRIPLINVAKIAIPLKNLILMRNIDDKIALLKSSGSCIFCDLTQGNFKGSDLKGVDLRYANLSKANLNNSNLSGTNLRHTNLSGADLSGVDLSNKDLTESNLSGVNLKNMDLTGIILSGVDLSNKDLTGTILTFAKLSGANLDGVDLSNKDLTRSNLSGVDLSNTDLTGTILTFAKLSGANLDGVDLSNKDLTRSNLSGVDLSNKDLTGTILTFADLSGANLDGVDLRNKDLTGTVLSGVDLSGVNLRNVDLAGTILSGVDLSNKDLTGTILTFAELSGANLDGVDFRNKDLTGTILKDAKKIEIIIKNSSNSNWPAINEIQNLNITRYDLSGDVQYVTTKEGFLFESKNNESRLVLDLNTDAQFPFGGGGSERGLLGIVSQNNLVYVSYTSQDINGSYSLVVDEYSMNFTKARNIIKIGGFIGRGFGGSLSFDSFGRLYLSVGDGGEAEKRASDLILAQNLNSLKGKILRLDVSKFKLEPEIIAYGIRNGYGVTIDSKDRMFILQCGRSAAEAVYFLNDLYTGIPVNFGWPVFEGSIRMRSDPLMFEDVSAPIFETNKRPGCLTAGVYLDDIDSFLFGDFFGTIRLLKQKEDGNWYLLHEDKQEKVYIWGFGLDKKTQKIFIAPNNLELEILVDQVKVNL